MDLSELLYQAGLVAFGFVLASVWDWNKTWIAWRRQKKTLIAELRANETALDSRLNGLPEVIRQAIVSAWGGDATELGHETLAQLPVLAMTPGLRTAAWDSIVAQGLAPKLGKSLPLVSEAYQQTAGANYILTLSLPAFELSFNTALPPDLRESLQLAARASAVSPVLHCLPAIRSALGRIA